MGGQGAPRARLSVVSGLLDPVERLLTRDDIAVILGCSRRRVDYLIGEGAIASLKIGRSRRVLPADLRRFLDEAKERT